MIDRYCSKEMGVLWDPQTTLELWVEVEVAILEAMAARGDVPTEAVFEARATPAPDVAAVLAEEALTRHDVVAFVNTWTRPMAPATSDWVHRGVTSSDVVDTALALRLTRTTDLLLTRVAELYAALRAHAVAHAGTVRIGRTHGQAAAPTVWGLRVADLAWGVRRAGERLRQARADVALMTVSGPVGTYSALSPDLELRVAERLGLCASPVSTQVVMRDGIAHWMACLAGLTAVCEAVALEVRHGQRLEVGELAESFAPGQAGSSSMPHKRNPVTAEKICGLARVVRGYVGPALEDVALWHERDISHSSVERICLPDAASITEHVVTCTTELVARLHVDVDAMARRLADLGAIPYTNRLLIDLVDAGLGRAEAYDVIRASSSTDPARLEDSIRAAASARGVDLDAGFFASAANLERELRFAAEVIAGLPRDLGARRTIQP